MDRISNEYARIINFLIQDNNKSGVGKIITKALESSGLGEIPKILGSLGYKITIKKKGLNKNCELVITKHARERTNNYLTAKGNSHCDDEKLSKMFLSGPVIDYADLLAFGYRPKKDHAADSVYVQMKDGLIAVASVREKEIIWITTLSETRTPHHRMPITEEELNKFLKRKSKNN